MEKDDGDKKGMNKNLHDDTLCLDRILDNNQEFNSLVTPVYRASTIVFPTVEKYNNRREQLLDGFSYGHYGTPTSRELELRVSLLEESKKTVLVPSGMAAITLTSFAAANPGQKILFPDSAYDTVRAFTGNLLKPLGIHADFYDPLIGEEIAELLDDDVALVWVESPGSFSLEIQDIPAICKAAHAKGILVAADNTWATPLRCKPLNLGVDISINSISKYFAGHSDVVMGSISIRDDNLHERIKTLSRYFGYGVHADAASLVLRGMETLAIRLDRSEQSALELARWLHGCSCVAEVRHPAFETHPGHEFWKRDYSGSTGLFSIKLIPAALPHFARGVEALRYFKIGSSWGGTHSVIAPLIGTPLRTERPWDGVGPVARVNIGLENVEDLKKDFRTALTIWGG